MSPDRYVRIISVGMSWTNNRYYNFFNFGCEITFKTIDPFHNLNSLEDHVMSRFEQFNSVENYDAILLNGVICYGTDTLEEVVHILKKCSEIL